MFGFLPAWIFVDHMCVWCHQRSVQGAGSSRSLVTEGCEHLGKYWESNMGFPSRRILNCWPAFLAHNIGILIGYSTFFKKNINMYCVHKTKIRTGTYVNTAEINN